MYKFTCAGCNASYIGETARHISTRVREHLVSDKASHASNACRDSCSTECFTVLHSANSCLEIEIGEAFHIKWSKPALNQQLQHVQMYCHKQRTLYEQYCTSHSCIFVQYFKIHVTTMNDTNKHFFLP